MRRSPVFSAIRDIPGPGPLGWVVAASFFHFASFYYLFATLPLYVRDLGGSSFQVGLLNGLFSLASLTVRPFFGLWMDRAGRLSFLLAGATIYILAALGYLVISSVPGILLWRVFHAMGLATFSTAAASVAGDLAPSRRRGTTMGIYGLAQAAALGLGPGVGSAVQQAAGYSGLFLAAACTAGAALACTWAVPETVSKEKSAPLPAQGVAGTAGLRSITVPALFQFAASIAYGSIVSFIALVATDRGIDALGTFFALLALSSLGVRLAAGRAYDAWGPLAVLAPSFLLLATGMFLLAVTVRAGIFLGAAVLAGAGIGATHTTMLARVVDRSPSESRGSAVAVFTSCWELGVGGGTVLMGLLAQVMGFSVMYLVAASLPLVGLGATFFIGKSEPKAA